MALVNDDLAQAIERNGYAIVPGLFSSEEVAHLRSILIEHFAKRGIRHNLGWTQPNAAIEVERLGWLYSLPNVVKVFQRALRRDDIVFTGHCDIHDSMLSGWHKDSGEHRGGYFKGDYFNADDCKVYKMAVYLEDHHRTGTGLSVRKGSHRVQDLNVGEEMSLDTRAGDAIIFDVRVTHVGQRPDFLERVMLALNRRIIGVNSDNPDVACLTFVRALYSRVKREGKRLSVFFTYGYPNCFTDQFSGSNMARQLSQTKGTNSCLPQPVKEELKRAGVALYSGLE